VIFLYLHNGLTDFNKICRVRSPKIKKLIQQKKFGNSSIRRFGGRFANPDV
jgi:hypothetical protein